MTRVQGVPLSRGNSGNGLPEGTHAEALRRASTGRALTGDWCGPALPPAPPHSSWPLSPSLLRPPLPVLTSLWVGKCLTISFAIASFRFCLAAGKGEPACGHQVSHLAAAPCTPCAACSVAPGSYRERGWAQGPGPAA